MTDEELIEMAEQAGFMFTDGSPIGFTRSMLKDFAKLVAEKEREACAKVADGWSDYDVQGLAEEIRARKQE
jgi:hypothetical protein